MKQKFKCLDCGKKTKQAALAIEAPSATHMTSADMLVAHCPSCMSICVVPYVSKLDIAKDTNKQHEAMLLVIFDRLGGIIANPYPASFSVAKSLRQNIDEHIDAFST